MQLRPLRKPCWFQTQPYIFHGNTYLYYPLVNQCIHCVVKRLIGTFTRTNAIFRADMNLRNHIYDSCSCCLTFKYKLIFELRFLSKFKIIVSSVYKHNCDAILIAITRRLNGKTRVRFQCKTLQLCLYTTVTLSTYRCFYNSILITI